MMSTKAESNRSGKVHRSWGYYKVLHQENDTVKVKELVVNPNGFISMQRHEKRAEHWFVSEGTASVYTLDDGLSMIGKFTKFESLHIDRKQWHQLKNETDNPLKIIEIQYGENCIEDDIERI